MNDSMTKTVLIIFSCLLVMSCGESKKKIPGTDQAMEEVRELYEKAREKAPDDPVGWAKDDIKRFGDWEYKVVSISSGSNSTLEDELNSYGEERWEVFWVKEQGSDLQVMFKRPAKSYLRSVPFSELGKAITGGDGSE